MKPCETELVPINSVIPYEKNNKIHDERQVNRIANSIKRFGFNQPIVVDENNIILVGHGRYLASRKLGLSLVPVWKRIGLTETDKREYRIADNKVAADTDFDLPNLKIEVAALQEAGVDMATFGFDEFKFEEPEVEAPEEKEEPEKKEWVAEIKLKVPAETVDHFEPELDALLKKYNGIEKKTKRQ